MNQTPEDYSSSAPPPPIPSPHSYVPPVGTVHDTGDGTGGIIPYKNPQALLSYYIGLFSLIPCLGLGMGPAALYLGFKGLQYANAHPIVKGKAHAWVGIICGSIWSLVHWGFLIFGLLGLFLTRT